MCSCPITADSGTSAIGCQIVGPHPCRQEFFDHGNGAVANTDTGSSIVVWAPTGTPRHLTEELYGNVPELNHCELGR